MNNKNPKDSQNFITSQKYINEILQNTNIESNDNIIEIGTGKGHFTKTLLKISHFVTGIEIDRNLYYKLKKDTDLYDNLKLINKDVLRFQFHQNEPYKIFGSIPYNISTEIIKKILYESKSEFNYLIVELGFAKRLLNKKRALSLLLLPKMDVEILKIIPNVYFHPKPTVDSALILLKRHKPLVSEKDEKIYHFFVYRWVNKEYKKLFTKNQFNKTLNHANVQDINELSKEQFISIFNSYKLFN
ncbi:23S ribosomal RNA methyltransferase Erm [Staphylococcus arlettae]|uniref:23S ribosomal RNA methyltransferase Erm n=1 Tax=Staphylococcus arlettae TaxID=29378 RepID=UPI0035132C37